MTDPQIRDRSATMREALQLWRDVTGLDPAAEKMSLGHWSLRETIEEIEEALALDPTELTALLLLDGFARDYLGGRTVPLLDLLQSPESILRSLDQPRRLMALLNSPDITSARTSFLIALLHATMNYDAGQRKDVQEMLQHHQDVAVLRRDALRSISGLRVDQFLAGASEPAGVAPIYNRVVHQWWNVNSLLAAATHMPSGVSLNLIRDPDAFQSYFCFAVRNGGNLLILSDAPDLAHPLQGSMRRRPDRVLDQRAGKHWFPYELLDLEYDEATRRMYQKEHSSQRALVAYQNAALPLKPIAELNPESVLWTTMMFDLIIERFWKQGYQAPVLSYTAEMLQRESVLIEAARSANLPVPAYQTMGLPPLTIDDISGEALDESAIGRRAHDKHDWMEQRYAAQVNVAALNLLGQAETTFAIAGDTGHISDMGPDFAGLSDYSKSQKLAGRRQIEKVAATTFGSREQLERDRRFIARYNYAAQIDTMAKAEFDARKQEIQQWYRKAVEANKQNWLPWTGHEHLWLDDGVGGTWGNYEGMVGPKEDVNYGNADGTRHLVRSLIERQPIGTEHGTLRFVHAVYLGEWRGPRQLCYVNGTQASYDVVLAPANAAELAALAGCSVAELPDVLQHWSLVRPYIGNSILDRVDPMLWHAQDPWAKLDFRIRIALSKRALAKSAQQATLPPLDNLYRGPRAKESA